MSEPRVTYYAKLAAGRTRENPSGIVRRIHTDPPTDEAFTRSLTWRPSEYLERYRLGHNDTDHVEITEEDANTIIERWKARGPIEDAQNQTTASRDGNLAVAILGAQSGLRARGRSGSRLRAR